MRRRVVIASLAGASGVWLAGGPSRPQQAGRTYRLAILTPLPRNASHWIALLDELRVHGFVQGTNVAVTGFNVAPDQLETAAVEMVRQGVDVILCGGTGPTRAAQRATNSVPILTAVDDFVAQKFVTSLASPAGNITGVSILGPELDGKRQEILFELAPGVRRIAVLRDPAATPPAQVEALRSAASTRGVALSIHDVGRQPEIGPAIEAGRAGGAQAFNVLAAQFFNVNRAEIITHMARAGLPAIYQWPEWIAEGALCAYGPRFTAVYRQIARQLARVLRGARPADIPVEQPTLIELAVNLRTARALGVTIPPAILARADEVIE